MNISTFLAAEFEELGRIDKASLSDQVVMEIFVSTLDDNEAFTQDGDFIDIAGWPGVGLSADGRVSTIDWERDSISAIFGLADESVIECGGSIDFRWLPEQIEGVCINDLLFEGSIDTSCLPRSLHILLCDCNELSGSFALKGLPQNIVNISISSNSFEGSLYLRDLPPSIEIFCANENKFSGSVDLLHLPIGLFSLDLSSNMFSGEIDLRRIPPKLESLSLQLNNFRQDVLIVGEMPVSLHGIGVDADVFGTILKEDGHFPTIAQKFPGLFIQREGAV